MLMNDCACRCRLGSRRLASTADTSPPVTVVLASTASILVVAVSLVVNITTGTLLLRLQIGFETEFCGFF